MRSAGRLFAALATALAIALLPMGRVEAKERREVIVHQVYRGQRLGSIAKRYQISIAALCRANGIQRNDVIHPGDRLVVPTQADEDGSEAAKVRDEILGKGPSRKAAPERRRPRPKAKPAPARRRSASRDSGEVKVHTVYAGQRLGSIARRYRTTVEAIAHANGIDPKKPIHPGDRLVIPAPSDDSGARARAKRAKVLTREAQRRSSRPRRRDSSKSYRQYLRPARRPGKVTLTYRGKRYSGYVIGRGNKLLPYAQDRLRKLLGSGHDMHPRLLRLLTKVSDAFGGRPLRIVSGYRTHSYASNSRHKSGQACDFMIPGVPNEALRDYLLRFDDVGVGYYPNSSFVHFDVRATKTYWVDLSGPGEPPRYVYKGRDKPRSRSSKSKER